MKKSFRILSFAWGLLTGFAFPLTHAEAEASATNDAKAYPEHIMWLKQENKT